MSPQPVVQHLRPKYQARRLGLHVNRQPGIRIISLLKITEDHLTNVAATKFIRSAYIFDLTKYQPTPKSFQLDIEQRSSI